MTELLFLRSKNTVPVPIGFQLQNFESNYLTQQKPNRALFLFSISNSECELDSHRQCDRNRRKRNRFPYSFTLAQAGSILWKIQQDIPPVFTALVPSSLYLFCGVPQQTTFGEILWNLKFTYFWHHIQWIVIWQVLFVVWISVDQN